jgi:hypothetical protein
MSDAGKVIPFHRFTVHEVWDSVHQTGCARWFVFDNVSKARFGYTDGHDDAQRLARRLNGEADLADRLVDDADETIEPPGPRGSAHLGVIAALVLLCAACFALVDCGPPMPGELLELGADAGELVRPRCAHPITPVGASEPRTCGDAHPVTPVGR